MTPTRTQLLNTICALVADPGEAARIRNLDPDDELTFAEAYCAVRDLPTLTPELRRRILDEIYVLADRRTERVLRGKTAAGLERKPYLAAVLRLVQNRLLLL